MNAVVVHQLEVEVRLGGGARVPALGDLHAGMDRLASGDPERAATQMGEDGVDAVPKVEDHVVAESTRLGPVSSRRDPSANRYSRLGQELRLRCPARGRGL